MQDLFTKLHQVNKLLQEIEKPLADEYLQEIELLKENCIYLLLTNQKKF